MRTIGLCIVCVLLVACTTPPMFPSRVMKDVETDTFGVKHWKEQTYYPSGAHFVSHKVRLGGQIAQVIRKPDGVVLLAEEQTVNKYLEYGPTSVRLESSFEFAIALDGSPDADILQAGNQLAAVGAMDSSSPEVIGRRPRVLPHLRAQYLHIWKTKGFETDFVPWEGLMSYYPLENEPSVLKRTS